MKNTENKLYPSLFIFSFTSGMMVLQSSVNLVPKNGEYQPSGTFKVEAAKAFIAITPMTILAIAINEY